MKTKQTKKRVSYRFHNTVVEIIEKLMKETGKTATQIVEESVLYGYSNKLLGSKNEKS